MNDAVATIADIDNAGTPSSVPNVPAEGPSTPPAAENAQVAPVATPTEGQDRPDPENPEPPSQEGEPEWFKKRLKDISRQRRNEERRADRLAAELETLKRAVPQQQPKAQELRPQDFPNYDAFHAARTEQVARDTVRAEIEAATKTGAEIEEAQANQRARETFLERAQAEAEEADIDLDAVMETISIQPRVSRTVAEYLAKSEVPARLAEYLAKNPGKLLDVSMMGPALARSELAKVEAGLKSAAAKPPATKAPPPGPTAGGRGIAQKSVDKMDMDEFASHFMASEEARLKRM